MASKRVQLLISQDSLRHVLADMELVAPILGEPLALELTLTVVDGVGQVGELESHIVHIPAFLAGRYRRTTTVQGSVDLDATYHVESQALVVREDPPHEREEVSE